MCEITFEPPLFLASAAGSVQMCSRQRKASGETVCKRNILKNNNMTSHTFSIIYFLKKRKKNVEMIAETFQSFHLFHQKINKKI